MEVEKTLLAKARMLEYFGLKPLTLIATLRTDLSFYELWKGRKPNIGYFYIFNYTCYILNNGKTYLIKF